MKRRPHGSRPRPTCQYGIRSERLRVDRAQQPPILPDDGNARVLGAHRTSKLGGQDRPPRRLRLAQALLSQLQVRLAPQRVRMAWAKLLLESSHGDLVESTRILQSTGVGQQYRPDHLGSQRVGMIV